MKIVRGLILEGHDVVATKTTGVNAVARESVQGLPFFRWWGKVVSFGHQLGRAADPWKNILSTDAPTNSFAFAVRLLGTLEAIEHEIENDCLAYLTELVRAEAMGDLLQQALHLEENGYYLAAGVLGRSVLEEHLRATCDTLECVPEIERPTSTTLMMRCTKQATTRKHA